MSIQAIINTAQTMEFDLRKTIGQSISRSQRIKTAERATAQPFVITITPIARFRFSENRGILETIVSADRNTETQVYIGSGNLSYITEYRGNYFTIGGGCVPNAPKIVNFTGTTVTMSIEWDGISFGCIFPSPAQYLKAGDWIQPTNSRYPYIVTADVTTAATITGTPYNTSTFTATVHRPLITSEGVAVNGQTLLYGTQTTMRVLVSQIPTYRLRQKDWAEFTDDFVLIEKVI